VGYGASLSYFRGWCFSITLYECFPRKQGSTQGNSRLSCIIMGWVGGIITESRGGEKGSLYNNEAKYISWACLDCVFVYTVLYFYRKE